MESEKLIEVFKFDNGDSRVFYCAKDQNWSPKARLELWKDHHIIMKQHGVVAVRVQGKIISLCSVHDGSIAVDSEHDLGFHVCWVDDLIKALELAKKKIQDAHRD